MGNVNNSRLAQDNLIQLSYEKGAGLTIITEPNKVPKNENWIVAKGKAPRVAMLVGKSEGYFLPVINIGINYGVIAIKWGEYICIGIYQSPNKPLAEFKNKLKWIGNIINEYKEAPVLIAGDLNSRHKRWDRGNSNQRGTVLENWIIRHNLHILNPRFITTCIHPRGLSVVDLFIGNKNLANKLSECSIGEIIVNSDHRWITLSMRGQREKEIQGKINKILPRWIYKGINTDMLNASMIAESWEGLTENTGRTNLVDYIDITLHRASDIAMSRYGGGKSGRKQTYWWSDNIAKLRSEFLTERRKYIRIRKKGNNKQIERAKIRVKVAKKKIKTSIIKAKEECWKELLATLEADPWGRPYKIVTRKLAGNGRAICEAMSREDLELIISGLFPSDNLQLNKPNQGNIAWIEEYGVTDSELKEATIKLNANKKAPGPDGIYGGIVKAVVPFLGESIKCCFNQCLKEGKFPANWKMARLVLLKKGNDKNTVEPDPSKYRPICLLNEIGKTLERIIASRLNQIIEDTKALSDNQFGFRKGKSTIDAIQKIKSNILKYTSEGRWVVMVCIDIKNAFNSIPWNAIRGGLDNMDIPGYLREIINSYLNDRSLIYTDNSGRVNKRSINRGVPQGSVLGPTLWNVGYNSVLSMELPVAAEIVCYADDTVLLISGVDSRNATHNASLAVGQAIKEIEKLGLTVATNKTEVMVFPPVGERVDDDNYIVIKNKPVRVRKQLKYLGILIDERWRFTSHIKNVTSKAIKALEVLRGITTNLRGPSETKRKLYASAVTSIVTYAAPIWATEIKKNPYVKKSLNNFDRVMAQRVCCAYKTVAGVAALLVAGMIPTIHIALKLDMAYWEYQKRRQEEAISYEERMIISQNALKEAQLEWFEDMRRTQGVPPGLRAKNAIVPCIEKWYRRSHGTVTFYVTQIITGHGCFKEFLYKIKKTDSKICELCRTDQDNAQHVLETCNKWCEERLALTNKIGSSLNLQAVIKKMLENKENWTNFTKFCTTVIRKKEVIEREEERKRRNNR